MRRKKLLQSFNSTMVRLKGSQLSFSRLRYDCFNSTMVRLKVKPRIADIFALPPFQFHNGSIKSWLCNGNRLSMSRFNSTMVRLKDRNDYRYCRIKPSFNSTMVRLKAELPTDDEWRSIHVSIPQWFD